MGMRRRKEFLGAGVERIGKRFKKKNQSIEVDDFD